MPVETTNANTKVPMGALLGPPHNRLAAEHVYGAEFIQQKIDEGGRSMRGGGVGKCRSRPRTASQPPDTAFPAPRSSFGALHLGPRRWD